MNIIFGLSSETSDFIVDGIELWWEKNKSFYNHIKNLVINLDNGPQIASSRTQFMRRMIEFSNATGLNIHLVYYPPYHSKYNSIERCWGVLERHWNGAILSSVKDAIGWASTMTWKGIDATVDIIRKTYEKGITVSKTEMKSYRAQIKRSKTLPKWDVIITSQKMVA